MSDISNVGEQVLRAVSLLGGETYGVPLRQKVSDLMKQDVSYGTVYVVLEHLEFRGYVNFHEGQATPQRGGRAKRQVTLTDLGRQAAAAIEARYHPAEPRP